MMEYGSCRKWLPALLLASTGFSCAAYAQADSAPTGSAPTEVADAAAADAAAADAGAGEIVVTAQKRSERLSDVPMSITAATGEQLTKQGITDTAQLTKLVPGFTYQQSNYGNPVFAIRGIGFVDNSVTAGSTVTVYVDQVPLPFAAMTRGATLDLERVEALKGPQGTLFGQNSTGGAINYIAAKPTDSLKAGIDLSYGRFNEVVAGGFVSGPISDTLRARVAVRQEYMDGWQKSITRPGDTLGRKRFYNGRLLLDWEPSDDIKFELNVSGWQDQSDNPAVQFIRASPQNANITPRAAQLSAAFAAFAAANNEVATGPREADWDAGGDFARNDKFYLISLRGDWQINDALTLTSITAYSHMTTHRPIDLDGTAFSNFSYERQDGLLKSFSEELRLAGDMGPLKWVIGGNYQRQTANEFQLLHQLGASSGLDLGPPPLSFLWDRTTYINNQRPITKSAFGSFDYKVTEQVTVRASARYTDEKRRFSGCLADAGEQATGQFQPIRDAFAVLSTALRGGFTDPDITPTVIAPGACITLDDATFLPGIVRSSLSEDNFSWRAGIDWKPNRDSLLYVTVAKGYKSGGYSVVPAILASQIDPVTQEALLSYEAGFRTSAFDRKLQVSGAVFYYDYSDKQLIGWDLTQLFGRLPKLVNIPKSRVAGAELELTARPVEGLRLSGGITYIDSKVQKDPADALDSFGQPTSFVGDAFPSTPKWQGVADAEYNFPASDSVNLFVGGSATYRSSTFAAFGDLPEFKIPAYTLFDARAGVESADGQWRIQAYGRNITNKWYWVNVGVETDAIHKSAGMGATYGVAFSYRY